MGAKTKSKSMVLQKKILESQVKAQQVAFERVGAELYENVGQMLSVAQFHLSSLEESGLNTEQLDYVHQTSDIITRSITDIRALIRYLETCINQSK